MKRLFSFLMITGLLMAVPAHAEHGDMKQKTCPMDKKCGMQQGCSICGQADCDVSTPCPITQKFFKKTCFLTKNADEIGLSDDQLKQIKTLKNEVKKQALRDMAEWQVFDIEVLEMMGEETVDTEAIGAKIDQMTQAMTASTKKTVDAYVKVKNLLSADQKTKAKAAWKKMSSR